MNEKPFEGLKLFPFNAHPYGLSYEQWSMKWWSWILQIPEQSNPAFDMTGRNAYAKQDNPHVFFLCQTFDRKNSSPCRIVTIQKGTSLFFPVINWISVSPGDGKTEADLILKAETKMNTIGDLKLKINGRPICTNLEKYRVKSRPFHVNLPRNNILKLNPGVKKVVSDGYWILTEAIIEPIHLVTFGSCSAGLTKIGVNYEINIVGYQGSSS